jgi:hypothetical protein
MAMGCLIDSDYTRRNEMRCQVQNTSPFHKHWTNSFPEGEIPVGDDCRSIASHNAGRVEAMY